MDSITKCTYITNVKDDLPQYGETIVDHTLNGRRL